MVGAGTERQTFQELAADFDKVISEQGSVTATILVRDTITGTSITYLPGKRITIEGFPNLLPYFSINPEGVYLDRENTKPAPENEAPYYQIYRMLDPRLIAETQIQELEEDQYPFGGRLQFDLAKALQLPDEYKQFESSREAEFMVDGGKLFSLTMHDFVGPSIISVRFSYPNP